MDTATLKQKAYIKDLFVKCGVPKWIFNPLKLWNISKDDACQLITTLLILKTTHHGDLREIICQDLEGKNILQETTNIDQQEEETDE